MLGFSAFSGTRQGELHTQRDINDLPSDSFGALLADALNPRPQLDDLRPSADASFAYAPSAVPRKSRGRSTPRRVQLNIGVTGELRRSARTTAKRCGQSLAGWVIDAIVLHIERCRQ